MREMSGVRKRSGTFEEEVMKNLKIII